MIKQLNGWKKITIILPGQWWWYHLQHIWCMTFQTNCLWSWNQTFLLWCCRPTTHPIGSWIEAGMTSWRWKVNLWSLSYLLWMHSISYVLSLSETNINKHFVICTIWTVIKQLRSFKINHRKAHKKIRQNIRTL